MTEQTIGQSLRRNVVIGWTVLAGLFGIYQGHHDDLPPFYVRKSGTSGGICVAGKFVLDEGATFNGLVLSAYGKNMGTINGAYIPLLNNYQDISNKNYQAKVNGLEVTAMNSIDNGSTNGGAKNAYSDVNGVAISLLGVNNSVRGLGIYGVGGANQYTGIQAGGLVIAENMRGLQIGAISLGEYMDGLQIGAIYGHIEGHGPNAQIGAFLRNRDKEGKRKNAIGFNYGSSKQIASTNSAAKNNKK